MSSVDEILERLRLRRQDLNTLSSSQIRSIFEDLTVKEISILCGVNRKFNLICEDEKFWKDKVFNDYGIEKKYGETWRETAKNMSKVNMINLNAEWIDGRTCGEILDDTLNGKALDLVFKQKNLLIPFMGNLRRGQNNLHSLHEEKQIQHYADIYLQRRFTDDELDDIYYIKTTEIYVIYAAVRTYQKGSIMYKGLEDPGYMTLTTNKSFL